MKAFYVTQVGIGRYRLTFGPNSIEGNIDFIGRMVGDEIKDRCQDLAKDDAYRFEFASVLPSRALANAVYELESVTRAKDAFYRACKDGAPIKERRELFDNLVTAATTLNLDNLWAALGVSAPDQAA